ncbi:urease accessory protein UreF [Blochmannia endosymbiont of Camponotus (Colobopsis) obliquus]|uniref:urease accessory protein UreF n=1 Tax=Blochmannia endosymbiont of Camponotus (Colobopsis) obliquus TaxID=1505597 RepID=UPI00061A5516|nr:urease accessory UreF family protein [Blochmannia endosymbiont of Camponotus (Colobopsis) obliquus]AKC60668.1 urease accessory protein UreF [Blochmannia endosymbiont of Camponotus (Colobopsis) obliquus]
MDNISQIDDLSLLHVIQLGSAAFPSGGYSYSQGLEWAVHFGLVNSISTFACWQEQVVQEQLTYLDWPILKRMYFCIKSNDQRQLLYYIEALLMFRTTCELRLEEKERGYALMQMFFKCSLIEFNDCWFTLCKNSMLSAIAWLGNKWEIPLKMLVMCYGYIVVEGLITAGLKLVPFGQCSAQKLLMAAFKWFSIAWRHADLLTDEELGGSFPLQSIASSCHEEQKFRLFRS